MKKISIIIHSLNEEKNIKDCINSAKLLTDEIILVDMESSDKTVEIAKSLNVYVFNFPKSNYVEPAREFGIKQAKTDWVLILDADERMTKELADEIQNVITLKRSNVSTETFYKIPRRNIFAGVKWLRHGGWWPDYQTRLINKKYFLNWPKRIHSTPVIKGNFGLLKNPLTHYFHGDISNMVNKTITFENIESELLYRAGKKTTTKTFFRKFLAELYRRLIKNLGFFDGTFGVIESFYQAFSKTITYLFLYEKSLPAGRQVGIYDPFLDTLGGGEKYILSIMDVFADLGYEVNIFWDKDLSREIKERFSFRCIDTSKFINKKNLKNLWAYDYFFYITDGSYFFSGAKKNFVYAMIPDKKLYSLNLINRLKLINYQFITHSLFTQKWLKKFGIKSTVIMPYLDDKLINKDIDSSKKEKIILSVGRFFSHLHSKKQDEIIKAFKILRLSSPQFKEYKLILAGGLMKEDQKYFDSLKKLSGNDSSIIFKPNVSLDELNKLYKLATYYWHFTGLGVDEEKHPEQVEHFGITPLEAMASGCINFCFSAGGPKELIKNNENGFLFSNVSELIDKMIEVNSNEVLKEKVINNGRRFVKDNFSYQVFKAKIKDSLI